jgi:hypothetical protein
MDWPNISHWRRRRLSRRRQRRLCGSSPPPLHTAFTRVGRVAVGYMMGVWAVVWGQRSGGSRLSHLRTVPLNRKGPCKGVSRTPPWPPRPLFPPTSGGARTGGAPSIPGVVYRS